MKNIKFLLLILISISLFPACQPDNDDDLDNLNNMGFNDIITTDNNNSNPNAENIAELGRLLFWDPILSGEKDVACATCHHPCF